MITRFLILICGALFILNSDICNYYYDSATQTADWWDLRFKMYSILFNVLGITVYINVKRTTKILMTPVLAIFLGDLKDRVFFDYTDRHWSDWALLGLSIIIMFLIWQKNESRGRSMEGNP